MSLYGCPCFFFRSAILVSALAVSVQATPTDPYIKKWVSAVQTGDAKAITRLAPPKTLVAPKEAGGELMTPKQLSKYFTDAFRTNPRAEAKPFKNLKEKENARGHIVALGGFRPSDPTIPNDVRVLCFKKLPKGWKLDAVIEAQRDAIDDVFKSHFEY